MNLIVQLMNIHGSKGDNVAFITLNYDPEYELKLVSSKEKTNE